MIQVLSTPPDRELTAFVRRWFDVLASGNAEDACGMLDEPSEQGQFWTPDAITAALREEFPAGSRFSVLHPEGLLVTPVHGTRGTAHWDVTPWKHGSGLWLNHDVPLNGEWSDLSAQFIFRRVGDSFTAAFQGFHVL